MSDDDFFMNDEVPKKNEDSDSSDLEDDWDVDEDEVAAKKAAKEAAKQAEIDKENERIRKLEARKKAEKEAEEERMQCLKTVDRYYFFSEVPDSFKCLNVVSYEN